ncbi:MAG: DUF364 domain-containing protein [Bacillota bacterium]|nr:DUF364 domain-containing protein [Bacillota bacterium]
MTARGLCWYGRSGSLLGRSVALAALNSLLEVDLARCREVNAADLLVERGRGKRVCVVGHFPFVPRLQEAEAKLWVLERRPREGDLPAGDAERAAFQISILVPGEPKQVTYRLRPRDDIPYEVKYPK